jgi:Tfp pilus assembly protein PilF
MLIAVTILITNIPYTTEETKTLDIKYAGDAFFEKGLVWLASDSLEKAEHAFRQALEYYPDFALLHYYLAEITGRQGRIAAAKNELRQAIEIDLEFYPAYYKLAILHNNENEYLAAAALLEKVILLNPYYRDAYHALIQIHIEAGDFVAAEQVQGQLRVVEEHTGNR